jgi:hypothetical protein
VFVAFYPVSYWRTPAPGKKKTARDLTTEELAKKVFPKKAIEKLKEIAHERDDKEPNQSSQECIAHWITLVKYIIPVLWVEAEGRILVSPSIEPCICPHRPTLNAYAKVEKSARIATRYQHGPIADHDDYYQGYLQEP